MTTKDERNICGAKPPTGPRPVPALQGLRPYTPPAPLSGIDLRLDGTERRTLPAAIAAALSRAEVGDLSRYPDAAALEANLAQARGAVPGGVLVTAGADEALDRICRAYLSPGRHAVFAVPTFEMLPHYARLAGGSVTEVEWFGGALPVEALGAAVTPETRVLGVVSPNNPTGAAVTADEVARLAAIDPSLLVVVDQAYGEFAETDLTPLLAGLPNVVSVRTLSKAYGLSGLRVGYAVAAPEVIAVLRAAGGPYSVARPSIRRALERLTSDDDVADYVGRIREERTALSALLTELGAEPLPSQANFVLSKFANAAGLDTSLAGAGIKVRAFPKNPALHGYRRITCPADAGEFDRLTAALRAALKGA